MPEVPAARPRYLVVAGNYRQFRFWLRESGVLREDAIYVTQDWDLFGRDPEDGWRVIWYGTYYQRPDLHQVRAYLRLHGHDVSKETPE